MSGPIKPITNRPVTTHIPARTAPTPRAAVQPSEQFVRTHTGGLTTDQLDTLAGEPAFYRHLERAFGAHDRLNYVTRVKTRLKDEDIHGVIGIVGKASSSSEYGTVSLYVLPKTDRSGPEIVYSFDHISYPGTPDEQLQLRNTLGKALIRLTTTYGRYGNPADGWSLRELGDPRSINWLDAVERIDVRVKEVELAAARLQLDSAMRTPASPRLLGNAGLPNHSGAGEFIPNKTVIEKTVGGTSLLDSLQRKPAPDKIVDARTRDVEFGAVTYHPSGTNEIAFQDGVKATYTRNGKEIVITGPFRGGEIRLTTEGPLPVEVFPEIKTAIKNAVYLFEKGYSLHTITYGFPPKDAFENLDSWARDVRLKNGDVSMRGIATFSVAAVTEHGTPDATPAATKIPSTIQLG